jgi:hypothetical protein
MRKGLVATKEARAEADTVHTRKRARADVAAKVRQQHQEPRN